MRNYFDGAALHDRPHRILRCWESMQVAELSSRHAQNDRLNASPKSIWLALCVTLRGWISSACRCALSRCFHRRMAGVVLYAFACWLILNDHAEATDLEFPVIDPVYTISVDGDDFASEKRGEFEVLAFRGNCSLSQGEMQATADELILWIDRTPIFGQERPGKIVCYLNGHVDVTWSGGQRLRDQRWMGRLFSLRPVRNLCTNQVQRHDIPQLDWNLSRSSPVSLAQYAEPVAAGAAGQAVQGLPQFSQSPPPLLGLDSRGANQASAARSGATLGTPIPPVPGAVTWQAGGSTRNSELLPPGGIVVPMDGDEPYSANEIQPPARPIPGNTGQAEFAPAFPPAAGQVVLQPPAVNPLAAKRVQFLPRSSVPPEITFSPGAGGESIGQIKGGFRLIVEGIQVANADGTLTDFGGVTLEADNAVFWIRSDGPLTVANLASGLQSTPERPIELYLDGNIVFYQGNRVIYADRMYYNVSSEYGMVLAAEVLTPVPQYQGLLRLKADVIQQQDRRNLLAYGAAITSSRLGVPRYWLQADEVSLADTRDENDLAAYAPTDALRPTNMRATARNNFVYLGGIPVLYWPTFSTDLSKPSYYLTSLQLGNDTIFGTQAYATFDAYQLLGIDGPEGTTASVSVGYLSERGPALGGRFDFNRPTLLFGAPGTGFWDGYFVRDSGRDFLGNDRTSLQPEEKTRGRILSQSRLFFTPNIELLLESGWVSDRNFLEQYFENEWEQEKDFTTAARLRRYNGNRMLDIFGQARVNDFHTETEWLPAVDHYILGQDLFSQLFTFNAHTSVAYAHQRLATTPEDPADAAKFTRLDWEADSEGLRAITRQELSMPLNVGAIKVVPFISGEAGFWNEDINQDDLTRLTGQAGLRTALPMWGLYPNVETRLFDLRGLAHKVTFESEFFYADSNADLDQLPLYEQLDDNAQEHFRRRFIFNTFGGALPPEFDERNYAFRTGMQRWVTASSSEVVDDLSQLRLGVNQRLQTKRGLAGRERIVDLMSLDFDFILFPNATRDNFGEEAGVFNYDFRYHVGDRLTLLSDGYMDVFSQGLKTISAGAQISRPGRGDAYLGLLSIEGPISASILNGSVNYRMNEKWIFNGAASFDFGETGSIGQSLGLTRIGETALVRVGMNVDSGRDNVSFVFNIEPRFLPTTRLGALGGELVPPAGLYGVE